MIRLWAKVMVDHKIKKDLIYESIEQYSRDTFFLHISEICHQLDIPTPVLINAHFSTYENFNNIKFLPRDFVESIDFDNLVIENALL